MIQAPGMVLLATGIVPGLFALGCFALFRIGRHLLERGHERRLEADLLQHFPYYTGLPPEDRARFRERINGLLDAKEFIGRGLEITRSMRTLVSASIVQLTFGLRPVSLSHFTRIIIYPDKYRSRIGKSDHVGEVNVGFKAIVLSWKRFVEDYRVGDDARNLGLHEMAHALWFQNRIGDEDEQEVLDPFLLREWRDLAQLEATRINAGRSRLFRKYAGENQEEFFAVAVEYFFERSGDFKREMPDLYDRMSRLLNQDPAGGER